MKGYNHVTLVGNLVKDAESNKPDAPYTEWKKEKSTFTIAVGRNYKRSDEQEVDFIEITSYGKLAVIVDEYLTKGRRVLIDGRIQVITDSGEPGRLQVVADEVTLLSDIKERG